jgi:hypothetical protein
VHHVRNNMPRCATAGFAIQCPCTEAPPAVLPDVLRLSIAFAEYRVRGANVASTLQVRQARSPRLTKLKATACSVLPAFVQSEHGAAG